MGKSEEQGKKKPAVVANDEDAATLAAIDEGIREAKSGRTVPLEEVRKRVPQSITNFSSRKER
jgi:predicted transcriptional regulator